MSSCSGSAGLASHHSRAYFIWIRCVKQKSRGEQGNVTRGLCPKTGRLPEMLSRISTPHRRWPHYGSPGSAMRTRTGWQPPAQAGTPHARPASLGTLASATLMAFCSFCTWDCFAPLRLHISPPPPLPLCCPSAAFPQADTALPSDAALLPPEPGWANPTPVCLHNIRHNLHFETGAETEATLLRN